MERLCQRKDVGWSIVRRVVGHDLWGGVPCRRNHLVRLGNLRLLRKVDETKIADHGFSVGQTEKVLRLEVTMADTFLMELCKRVSNPVDSLDNTPVFEEKKPG